MANVETGKRPSISFSAQIARRIAAIALSPVLRSEITNNPDAIDKAEKILESGHGLLIISSHFSKRDGPQLLDLIFRNKMMANKKMIAPFAYHMNPLIYRVIGKLLNVTPMSIVTQSTIDKGKNNGKKLGDGLTDYFTKAVESLREPEIVGLTPQGSRERSLGKQFKYPAVGTFMMTAERKHLDNYGVLFIALGIKGANDYSEKKAGNFNLLKKYTVNIGACLTNKEILERATILAKAEEEISKKPETPFRFVDSVIHEELRKIVPDAYK